MQQRRMSGSEHPKVIDVTESSERTWWVRDIEQAFYEMLEAVEDDAEELTESIAGPREKRGGE